MDAVGKAAIEVPLMVGQLLGSQMQRWFLIILILAEWLLKVLVVKDIELAGEYMMILLIER